MKRIIPEHRHIYSVSQLNMETRLLLENNFRTIWITGEISNLSCPSSGHIYFCLKDKTAQIRCALFRITGKKMDFTLENGQQVILEAQVSLYEGRGDYQLIVSYIELAGDGQLQLAFEKLKKKLAAEGLFDEKHKKALPEFPLCIGIITSPTGAALHDILTVLKRRFINIPIIIYPSMVQGAQAACQLVQAIKTANLRCECDVIILARGGGTLEDLWPFNEEIVARAIYASEIPIISGIGHEIDFTIADFVADVRAATPSAAAERVSPDNKKFLHHLEQLESRLIYYIKNKLKHLQSHLTHLSQRMRHPGQRLREQIQQLDFLERQLLRYMQQNLVPKEIKLQQLLMKLHAYSPKLKIMNAQQQIITLQQNLNKYMQLKIKNKQQQLSEISRTLNALSPLHTLERGYAIVRDKKTGNILLNAMQVQPGDQINAKLAQGELKCVVEERINSDRFASV